jgi:hypothetical protein
MLVCKVMYVTDPSGFYLASYELRQTKANIVVNKATLVLVLLVLFAPSILEGKKNDKDRYSVRMGELLVTVVSVGDESSQAAYDPLHPQRHTTMWPFMSESRTYQSNFPAQTSTHSCKLNPTISITNHGVRGTGRHWKSFCLAKPSNSIIHSA